MIRYVDSPAREKKLLDVLAGEDLLHGCILSTYWNAQTAGADFWVCENGQVPYGALLRLGRSFLFCSGQRPDLGELAEFLRFMDCRSLCGRLAVLEPLCSPLGLPAPAHAPAMACRDASLLPSPDAVSPSIQIRREMEKMRPVYDLILEHYEGFDNYGGGPGYDNWLSGMRLRERDGICGVWGLYVDGMLASTASILAASGRCIDIGALVTRRELRGRGYAARLLARLAALAGQSGRFPVLGCAREELVSYYRRLGFSPYDRWAAAEKPWL
ncbi:MAG: GNAT family N-acetyltransferase [Provencibacterium sp.]|jgi:GNAT superfamily N-acetyltransferase|nr:GNAT family N-acetyltransferase [Provencibacterium sp.]